MKKIIFIIVSIFLLFNNLQANSKSDYNKFKNLIKKEKFNDAMDIYMTKINGLETNQYQGYIFKKVIKLMSKDIDISKELLQSFLNIEFNNDFANYLLSQIELKNENYIKSIEVLFNLKNKYLSEKFSHKVNTSYQNSIDTYLSNLLKHKNINKVNELIFTFASYNDEKNLNKTYKLSFTIFKDYNKNGEVLKALEVLFKINKEYAVEELLVKFTNTINKNIKIYIKKLYKKENIKELEDLNELLNQYGDINNIQEVEKYLNRLREKDKLSDIYKKEIPLKKHGNNYLIDVNINGIALIFMLDTGASYTAINASSLEQIQYLVKSDINMNTANGISKEKMIIVENFSIDDIVLNNFELVSISTNMKNYDGLLGMNFLKKFNFHLDQKNSILRLN